MNKVFVGSLSWNTSEKELTDLFSQVGEIVEAKVITDRETGRSRGFGFVTFSGPEEANNAVERFNGVELDGRNINVNIAREKRKRNNFNRDGNKKPRMNY